MVPRCSTTLPSTILVFLCAIQLATWWLIRRFAPICHALSFTVRERTRFSALVTTDTLQSKRAALTPDRLRARCRGLSWSSVATPSTRRESRYEPQAHSGHRALY